MMHFAQLQPNYKWNSKAKKTIEAWNYTNRGAREEAFSYSFQVEAEEVPWPKVAEEHALERRQCKPHGQEVLSLPW